MKTKEKQGLIEANPQMTAKEIIDRIKMTASLAENPNDELGYGIPYYVSFKNNQFCNDCAIDYLITSTSGDGNPEKQVRIYPNSDESKLNVIFGNPIFKQTSFIIYNLSGEVVADLSTYLELPSKTVEIPIAELSLGYYFLKVINSNINSIVRFVKY